MDIPNRNASTEELLTDIAALHKAPHPLRVNFSTDAKRSAWLSNKESVDVRVYFKNQALSVGNENQKIAKRKGVRLQPCDSVSEAQDATVYCVPLPGWAIL